MSWMIYGASGYTGRLIAEQALRRGQRPVLAGRSSARIAPLADRWGLEQRVVELSDQAALRAALDGVDVVAHCAGPFSRTAEPMLRACLATGTHYVDITGEIDVLELVLGSGAEAERAGVVLLPGAGMDVVPTDCLAASLAAALPGATELDLAFVVGGGISPGTLKTALEGMGRGGRARVDGRIRAVPAARRSRIAAFPSRPRRVTAIPWGDVSTAFRSTGIPNITTYTYLPVPPAASGPGQGLLRPVLRQPAVRRGLEWLVDRMVSGPSERSLTRARGEIWGEARDDAGHAVRGTLTIPHPYALTADSVVRAVTRIGSGAVSPGAHTPSTAFGAGYVAELDGVVVHSLERRDVE